MKFSLLTLLALIACAHAALADVTVIGSLSRRSNLQPGAAFDGVVLLKNTGARTAEARVFQTDYACFADGRNEFPEIGTTARSNGGWFAVNTSRVKLEPGETVPVRYKGKAPADPKLRGTYWSMIMVEPIASASAKAQGKDGEVAMGLQTTIRFGVQIITEFGREGMRSLQVLDKCLVKAEGKRAMHLDIGNNGERLLIPAVGVELFDHNGSSVGRFDAGRMRIFPACSVRANIDLTNVPVGKYTAMVLLDSGDDQVMGAQYEVSIEP